MSAQPTQAKASAAVEPMTLAFDVTVSAVQELSPNFRRITFGGYSLRDFGVARRHPGPSHQADDPVPSTRRHAAAAARLQDGAVRLVPGMAGHGPGRPGVPCAPTPSAQNGSMPCTPRSTSTSSCTSTTAGNGGPAANWALNAKPGDAITIIGPNNRAAHCATAEIYGGIEWRPGLAQRVLLAGDETAVPAISAILESLPAYMSGHAFLEVPEAGDFLDLKSDADVEITWLARGASIGRSRPHGELLQDAVAPLFPSRAGWASRQPPAAAGPEPEDVDVDQDILWETPARMETAAIAATKNPGMPAGAMPFYAWIAGEAGVIKDLRRYLVRDVGIDRKQVAFMGYWRQGKAEL